MTLEPFDPESAVDNLRILLGLTDDTFDRPRGRLVIDLAVQRAQEILSPLPARARPVVLDAAVRGYSNPTGVDTETAGPYTRTYRSSQVRLTDEEKQTLRDMADDGSDSGAFTIRPGRAARWRY